MRRLALVAAVLVVVLCGAVVLSRVMADDTAPPTPINEPRLAAPVSGAGGGSAVEAVDVEGAQRAAVAAVALTDEVVTAGFISRRDLIASFTTTEFGPELADVTSDQVNALLVELGDRDADPTQLEAIEQPLTATATPTPTGVRVEVWSVLVVAAPGTGPARQVWRTVTVEMVEADGRWLVDAWSSTIGPTPALAAEVAIDSADDVAARIDTQSRVGG
jgi:hypothetical protein